MPLEQPAGPPLPSVPAVQTIRATRQPDALRERLPPPPLGEELRGLQRRQIRPQGARQPAGRQGLGVPEERDLSRGDLDHLDVVGLPGAAQQRRAAAGLVDAELVLAVGLHARTAAAFSSSRSPWNARPSMTTAGTSSTPAAAASAVASERRLAIEPSPAPLISAAGCISQAAAAISTVSRSPRSRPPANACRKAACENATPRPICFE